MSAQSSSETLAILFAIEQSVIDRDLAAAEENFDAVIDEIQALLVAPPKAKSPAKTARLAHLMMIQAHEVCQDENAPAEIKVYYAWFGAEQTVGEAENAAPGKDNLAEILSRIETIRKREGLAQGEYWERGNGPADFQELDDEFEEVLGRIRDTVFTFVLRRYRLDAQAELFERDRVEFEVQREVGRRFIAPAHKQTPDADQVMDEFFEDQYGPDALRRVHQRLVALRGDEEG